MTRRRVTVTRPHPDAWAHALTITARQDGSALGDYRRLRTLPDGSVVVVNNRDAEWPPGPERKGRGR